MSPGQTQGRDRRSRSAATFRRRPAYFAPGSAWRFFPAWRSLPQPQPHPIAVRALGGSRLVLHRRSRKSQRPLRVVGVPTNEFARQDPHLKHAGLNPVHFPARPRIDRGPVRHGRPDIEYRSHPAAYAPAQPGCSPRLPMKALRSGIPFMLDTARFNSSGTLIGSRS